jgi:hypothetical protein
MDPTDPDPQQWEKQKDSIKWLNEHGTIDTYTVQYCEGQRQLTEKLLVK